MKRFIVGTIIFVFVLIVGVIALPFLIPTDTIRTAVESRIEAQTGRKLTLAGDIKRSIFPNIGVEVSDVTFANADWAQEPVMISAKRAIISIKLLPLLSRQVEIKGLVLDEPVINLEIGPNGEKNWDLLAADETSTTDMDASSDGDGPAVKDISLEGVRITNGTVRFADSQTNERQEATNINVELSLKGLDEPFKANGDLVWNGEPITLALDLETPNKMINQEETRIDFALTSKPATIAFDGLVTPLPYSPQLDGSYELNIPSMEGVAKWAGQALPPELADLQSIALKGKAKYTFDGVDIDTGGTVVFKDKPAEFTLKAKSAGDPLGGTPIEIDGGLTSDLITASYKGTTTLGVEPLATGSFALNTPSPSAVAQWLGQPVPPELNDLKAIDLKGSVDLTSAGLKATTQGSITYKSEPITLSLDANAKGSPQDGAPIEAKLTAKASRFDLTYQGQLTGGDNPGINGNLNFSTASLAELAKWAGADLGEQGKPLGKTSLTTQITAGPTRAILKKMVLKLDEMVVKGNINAAYAGRPNITGSLDVNALDLDKFLPQTAATPATGTSAEGWSDDRIDLTGLKAADADLRLATGSLNVHGMKFGASRLHLVLKNGFLKIDIQELNLYGGRGVGTVNINASKATPTLDSKFKLSALQLRPFLRDAAGFNSLSGVGAFDLSITSSGVSQKQLASNLSGNGNLSLLDGAIYGVNIPAMLRNVSTAFLDKSSGKEQKTDFAALTASFKIIKGQLSNQDMSLQGPLLRALGKGTVDIANQRLDYRIDPKAVASLSGQGGATDLSGITVPILITGSWSNPKFKPDLAGLVDSILGDPDGAVDAIKGLVKGKGAKDALKGALGGALGGKNSTGGSALEGLLGGKSTNSASPQPSPPGTLDRGTSTATETQSGGNSLNREPEPAKPLSKKKKRKKLLKSLFN